MRLKEFKLRVGESANIRKKEEMGMSVEKDDFDEETFITVDLDEIAYFYPQDNGESTDIFFKSGNDIIIEENYLEFSQLMRNKV